MLIKQVIASGLLEDMYAPGKALGGPATASISKLVNPIIANVITISGIFAFFVIFFAGFNYISAGGDKAKVEQAQQMLNYGILGLVVVVTAYLITNLIGTQIGFKFF